MTAQTEAERLNLPNIERKQGGKQKGLNETHSQSRGEKEKKKTGKLQKKRQSGGSAEAGGAEEA